MKKIIALLAATMLSCGAASYAVTIVPTQTQVQCSLETLESFNATMTVHTSRLNFYHQVGDNINFVDYGKKAAEEVKKLPAPACMVEIRDSASEWLDTMALCASGSSFACDEQALAYTSMIEHTQNYKEINAIR